jgi:hypothetical protein
MSKRTGLIYAVHNIATTHACTRRKMGIVSCNINQKGNGPRKRLASSMLCSSQIAFPLSQPVSKSRTLRNSHVRESGRVYFIVRSPPRVLTFKRLQPPDWGPLDHRFEKNSSNSKWTKKSWKKKAMRILSRLCSSCCDVKLKGHNPATGFLDI